MILYRCVRKSPRSEATNEILRCYAQYARVRINPLKGPVDVFSKLTEENQSEALKNALAPLWNVPYPEQLDIKNEYVSYVISKYFTIMKEQLKNSKRVPPQIPKRKVENIFPSPVRYHYRTRDTFMVRPGIDGNPKTVGHIVGSAAKGKYACIPPVDILCPPHHCQVAKIFQDYIRQSELPACEVYKEGGNWTQIQVRSNAKGETMLLIKIHPQELTQIQISDECQKMKEYFENGPGSVLNLTSLYFQSSPFSNASSQLAPYQLLLGDKCIMEELNGRNFALSPGSFFQSNRKVAEIMYDKIFDLANLSPSTSILDLGCGIGTISILAAPYVRGSVGIDMSPEAIADAKVNAKLNNIHAPEFVVGMMEKKLKSAMHWLQTSSDIVAIINPGRCGVEVSLLQELRKTPQIGKIIYIACQPDHEWVIRNVLALLKPQGNHLQGTPFNLTAVVPFDMFPQTTHCEVVMKFER